MYSHRRAARMATPYVNAVYYPSWGIYKGDTPSSLNVEDVTHVFYAFIGINTDGTIRSLDEWGDKENPVDGEQGCLKALQTLKEGNPHIKTLISVGGGAASKEFPDVARNPVSRQTLATELRSFCTEHGFDGVDIDWEHPSSPQQGNDFIELLRDLRCALPGNEFLVTTALPAAEYCLKHINLVHLSQYVDFLNLMSYDFTGSWGDVAGHHAQLFARGSDDASLHPALRACGCDGTDYVLSQNFPSNKILLGVPVYARYFPRACCPGESNDEAGEMQYKDIPDDWVLEATVDEEHGTSSYVDESCDGKGFLSFDSPGTVRVKASFVHTMVLGGLFYWTGSADKAGELSLVSTGARELRYRRSQL